jgi:hypothetical protein
MRSWHADLAHDIRAGRPGHLYKKRSRAATRFFQLSVAPTTAPSSVKRVPRTTLFGRYPKAATNLLYDKLQFVDFERQSTN